jgi:hypothetical protein
MNERIGNTCHSHACCATTGQSEFNEPPTRLSENKNYLAQGLYSCNHHPKLTRFHINQISSNFHPDLLGSYQYLPMLLSDDRGPKNPGHRELCMTCRREHRVSQGRHQYYLVGAGSDVGSRQWLCLWL